MSSAMSSTLTMIRDRLASAQSIYRGSATDSEREQALSQLANLLVSARNTLTGAKAGSADQSPAYQITDQALQIARDVFGKIKTNQHLQSIPVIQDAIQVARLGCSAVGNACTSATKRLARDSLQTAATSIGSVDAPLRTIQSKYTVETVQKVRDALAAAQRDFDRAKASFPALPTKMVGGAQTLAEVFQEITAKTIVLRGLLTEGAAPDDTSAEIDQLWADLTGLPLVDLDLYRQFLQTEITNGHDPRTWTDEHEVLLSKISNNEQQTRDLFVTNVTIAKKVVAALTDAKNTYLALNGRNQDTVLREMSPSLVKAIMDRVQKQPNLFKDKGIEWSATDSVFANNLANTINLVGHTTDERYDMIAKDARQAESTLGKLKQLQGKNPTDWPF